MIHLYRPGERLADKAGCEFEQVCMVITKLKEKKPPSIYRKISQQIQTSATLCQTLCWVLWSWRPYNKVFDFII